jgi:hypothetical protein
MGARPHSIKAADKCCRRSATARLPTARASGDFLQACRNEATRAGRSFDAVAHAGSTHARQAGCCVQAPNEGDGGLRPSEAMAAATACRSESDSCLVPPPTAAARWANNLIFRCGAFLWFPTAWPSRRAGVGRRGQTSACRSSSERKLLNIAGDEKRATSRRSCVHFLPFPR